MTHLTHDSSTGAVPLNTVRKLSPRDIALMLTSDANSCSAKSARLHSGWWFERPRRTRRSSASGWSLVMVRDSRRQGKA